MRIIAGKHRGRKLAEINVDGIRPTADRVKESLFNMLAMRVADAVVLDLFCGSGNLGLECVSRGAQRVHFNDYSKNSLAVLNKNIAAMGEADKCKITNLDYLACLQSLNCKFDLIFLDPPYAMEYGLPALNKISERGLLNADGIAVYERDRPFEGQVEGLTFFNERKYGKTYLSFFKCEE